MPVNKHVRQKASDTWPKVGAKSSPSVTSAPADETYADRERTRPEIGIPLASLNVYGGKSAASSATTHRYSVLTLRQMTAENKQRLSTVLTTEKISHTTGPNLNLLVGRINLLDDDIRP
jgi:hypothetical protein